MFDINKKKHKSRNINRIILIRKKITRGDQRWLKEEKLKKKAKRKLKKEEEDNRVFFKYAPYKFRNKERIFYSAD
jgi:hypothetical protein